MNTCSLLAKQMREVYFGGNWTSVCFKAVLAEVPWQQAQVSVAGCNSVATLFCHASYYVRVLGEVLRGEPLTAKDEYSFAVPPIGSQEEWLALQQAMWQAAEQTAALMEAADDAILETPFTHERYGSYYRNMAGIIEHLHYHLGQIVIVLRVMANAGQETGADIRVS